MIKEKIMRGRELAIPIIEYCLTKGPYDVKLTEYLREGCVYDALEYAKLQLHKNADYEVIILSLESALETIREEYPS